VYVGETYAITEAVKKWRQNLLGQHFKIFTDQQSLHTLLSQTIQTPEQEKWTTKLQGYNFQILYQPGKQNVVVEALSRQGTPTPSLLFALSSLIPLLFQELQQFFKTSEGAQLIQSCTHDQQQPNLFSVRNGMLFFRHQLFLLVSNKFIEKILHEMHESPTNGHSSLKPTLAQILASFYWSRWKRDVKQFLQQCVTCQRNEYMP